MKFLFINPGRIIENKNIWSIVNSITPPLGLATLSAVLENNGYESQIIDGAALNLDTAEVLSMIDPHVDIVGLSAMTPEIDAAINAAKTIRAQFPNIKILMGGVHPTIFHKELIEDGSCDMVIRGEGEDAILSIAQGKPVETIQNLTWRTPTGKVAVNPQEDTFADLNKIPFPAYNKLPMKKYRSALGAAKRSPSIGVITSRGCPGKCTFCYSAMFGSKIRFMSAERVVELILHLKSKYGIREISFYDDTFTANRKRVEDLCRLLISEKVNVSWSCFARVDTVNSDLLKIMKEAGCHQIGYGFESADEEILNAINKKITGAKVQNAVSLTKNAGIDVRGAFMLGNPGETLESMNKTIEYSKKLGIQFGVYNITTPFPGTALFDWAVKNNYVKHTNWSLYDLAHPILELPTVSSDDVQKCYFKAYKSFYLRPSYIIQRLLSIRTKGYFMIHLKALFGILSMLMRKKRYVNLAASF